VVRGGKTDTTKKKKVYQGDTGEESRAKKNTLGERKSEEGVELHDDLCLKKKIDIEGGRETFTDLKKTQRRWGSTKQQGKNRCHVGKGLREA